MRDGPHQRARRALPARSAIHTRVAPSRTVENSDDTYGRDPDRHAPPLAGRVWCRIQRAGARVRRRTGPPDGATPTEPRHGLTIPSRDSRECCPETFSGVSGLSRLVSPPSPAIARGVTPLAVRALGAPTRLPYHAHVPTRRVRAIPPLHHPPAMQPHAAPARRPIPAPDGHGQPPRHPPHRPPHGTTNPAPHRSWRTPRTTGWASYTPRVEPAHRGSAPTATTPPRQTRM